MSDTTRLDEIRARLEAATPGPWKLSTVDGRVRVMAIGLKLFLGHIGRGFISGMQAEANAALIANAPSDLAYLLDGLSHIAAQRDAARAELARLEAGIRARAAREAALRRALRAYAVGDAAGPETAREALAADPTGEADAELAAAQAEAGRLWEALGRLFDAAKAQQPQRHGREGFVRVYHWDRMAEAGKMAQAALTAPAPNAARGVALLAVVAAARDYYPLGAYPSDRDGDCQACGAGPHLDSCRYVAAEQALGDALRALDEVKP